MIEWEGFAKVDMRVETIWSASLLELKNRQIIAVTNFAPHWIGKHMSEVLVLGIQGQNKECFLLNVDKEIRNGERVY